MKIDENRRMKEIKEVGGSENGKGKGKGNVFVTWDVGKGSKNGKRVIRVKKRRKMAKSMREEELFEVPIKEG